MLPNRAEISSLFNFKYFFAFLSILGIFIYFLFPEITLADSSSNCVSVYGATCPSSQLFIEKKVQNPKTGELVNVLSSSTVTFGPNNEVNFRIETKNTGTAAVSGVFVQDRLPGNIKFISSNPAGSFDQANNILSWTIDNLGPGESRFFQVKIVVKAASELNFDIACMTNFVQAQKDSQTASANAVFCIQAQALKAVPQVTETPKTGLPAVTWVLSALLLLLGFKFRRFSGSQIMIDKSIKEHASYICRMREFLKEEVK